MVVEEKGKENQKYSFIFIFIIFFFFTNPLFTDSNVTKTHKLTRLPYDHYSILSAVGVF